MLYIHMHRQVQAWRDHRSYISMCQYTLTSIPNIFDVMMNDEFDVDVKDSSIQHS